MIQDSQNFYKKLQAGEYAPLYLIFGEELYLVRHAVDYIKQTVVDEAMKDFNYNQFFAREADIQQVIDAVEQLPMMAAQRVVILREVENLNEKEWAALEPLLANPVPSTLFVLTGAALDKRKKGVKKAIESATVLELKKPYDNQIPGWIVHLAQTHGLEIDESAVRQLHRRLGPQLSEIDLNIVKIRDYISPRTRIEEADVVNMLPILREENIFELIRSIGEKNQSVAIQGLHRAMEQGQSAVGLVALLARQIRTLLHVKQGQKEGLFGTRLAQAVQVPPYFLDQYLAQAKVWTDNQLEAMLAKLAQLDLRLKSSPVSGERWLEDLVFALKS